MSQERGQATRGDVCQEPEPLRAHCCQHGSESVAAFVAQPHDEIVVFAKEICDSTAICRRDCCFTLCPLCDCGWRNSDPTGQFGFRSGVVLDKQTEAFCHFLTRRDSRALTCHA